MNVCITLLHSTKIKSKLSRMKLKQKKKKPIFILKLNYENYFKRKHLQILWSPLTGNLIGNS